MDRFGNDPRERDAKPVVRHLIPLRLCHKTGGAIVTDWQGHERHYSSVNDAIAAAAALYAPNTKRAMLSAETRQESTISKGSNALPNVIVWHAQRGSTYSRGAASKVRHLVSKGASHHD